MELSLNREPVDATTGILRCAGRLNAASAPALKQAIRDEIAAGRVRLVLDLSGVGFMDSSGLSALIAGLKYTRDGGGWLRLAGLGEQASTVVKLMRLDAVLALYPEAGAALES